MLLRIFRLSVDTLGDLFLRIFMLSLDALGDLFLRNWWVHWENWLQRARGGLWMCSHRGMLLCHVDLRELMPGPLTTIKTRFYET